MAESRQTVTLTDPKELEALASIGLEAPVQRRLDELLGTQKKGLLTAADSEELDALLERVDRLNLVKAKAQCALRDASRA